MAEEEGTERSELFPLLSLWVVESISRGDERQSLSPCGILCCRCVFFPQVAMLIFNDEKEDLKGAEKVPTMQRYCA